MRKEQLYEMMEGIDEKYIHDAHNNVKKTSHLTRTRWVVLVACLCVLVVGGFVVSNIWQEKNYPAQDFACTVIYNDVIYYVCGEGEISIIESCGLPGITKDMVGEHLGYLEKGEKNSYHISEKKNVYEIFEYAPHPNDNIYILCLDGKYYAAIRHDEFGYHGINDTESFE